MFMTMLALGVIGGLAVKDSIENTSCKVSDRQKAATDGRNYYWDSKGKKYYIGTGEEVFIMTEFNTRHPRTGKIIDRTKLVNKRTLKFVDWAYKDWAI